MKIVAINSWPSRRTKLTVIDFYSLPLNFKLNLQPKILAMCSQPLKYGI